MKLQEGACEEEEQRTETLVLGGHLQLGRGSRKRNQPRSEERESQGDKGTWECSVARSLGSKSEGRECNQEPVRNINTHSEGSF